MTLTVWFLHVFHVRVERRRSHHSQAPVALIRHFRAAVRAHRFRLLRVPAGRLRLFPTSQRRTIVCGHPQAVRHAAERRRVHHGLFLPDGRVPPLADGCHGHGVQHVVLSGTTEVIRHPTRGRRVHGHVFVVVVAVVAGVPATARFSGLAMMYYVHGRLSGRSLQPVAQLSGQFRREVQRYLRRRRVVHSASLARRRRRTAAVVAGLSLSVRHMQQTFAAANAVNGCGRRWRGPPCTSPAGRHRPGPAAYVGHGQVVGGPSRCGAPASAARVHGRAQFCGRPRGRRSAPAAARPLGRGQASGRQAQAAGVTAVTAATSAGRGRASCSWRWSIYYTHTQYMYTDMVNYILYYVIVVRNCRAKQTLQCCIVLGLWICSYNTII